MLVRLITCRFSCKVLQQESTSLTAQLVFASEVLVVVVQNVFAVAIAVVRAVVRVEDVVGRIARARARAGPFYALRNTAVLYLNI